MTSGLRPILAAVTTAHPLRLALSHVINVHTSGLDWVTIAAIVGGAVATIVAAIVSALVIRNTTAQTLAAEERRLHTRLLFERSETDRPELRTIIDPLAAHLARLDAHLSIVAAFTSPRVIASGTTDEVHAWIADRLTRNSTKR